MIKRNQISAEEPVLNWPTMRFNSRFADRLQTRRARRMIAALYLAGMAGVGGFVAWIAAMFLPQAGSAQPQAFPAVFWVLSVIGLGFGLPLVQRLLFLSIRGALPLESATFDERQQQLLLAAEATARRLTLIAMGVAFLAGFYMLLAATSAWPYSTPLYAGAGITLFAWAASAHHLVLAWRLQDDREEGDEARA